MLSIYKPAEKCSYWSTTKANMFKAKRLIKMGVPAISTRCSDHLSTQFQITAFTLPYSSKNSSVEHIHTLPTCLTLINTLTHMTNTHTHTHTHTLTHSLTHNTHTHFLSLSLSHAHRDIYKSVNMFG